MTEPPFLSVFFCFLPPVEGQKDFEKVNIGKSCYHGYQSPIDMILPKKQKTADEVKTHISLF